MLTTTFKEIQGNFNPRPPWGGRRTHLSLKEKQEGISIHALRGEGDALFSCECRAAVLFQSTPSVGRATPLHS